jgi:putative transposase
MKKTRFTETQIVSILKQQEAGRSVKDLAREHGINDATFYNWKAKYGGMEASDVKKMKDLEEENSRLKRIVANMTLEIDAVKTAVIKKFALGPVRAIIMFKYMHFFVPAKLLSLYLYFYCHHLVSIR